MNRMLPTAVLGLVCALALVVVGRGGEAPQALPASAAPSVPEAAAGTIHEAPTGAPIVLAVSPDFELPVLVTEDAALRSTVRPATASVPRLTAGRARVVTQGDTSRKRVALTFDAGADRGYTEQILDTLKANRVSASFGMTGQWAEANPDLVRRMVAEGHHLLNHTYSHDSFTGLSTGRGPMSRERRWSELDRTESAIQRAGGGVVTPYFRPPYGDYDASVLDDVGARGYGVVAMWTVDSLGWRGVSRAEIEGRCLRLAEPGAIYIFHVGAQAADGPALPAVIAGLRAQGYEMGSLPWLLEQ